MTDYKPIRKDSKFECFLINAILFWVLWWISPFLKNDFGAQLPTPPMEQYNDPKSKILQDIISFLGIWQGRRENMEQI